MGASGVLFFQERSKLAKSPKRIQQHLQVSLYPRIMSKPPLQASPSPGSPSPGPRMTSTGLVKKVDPRMRDPASWLSLFTQLGAQLFDHPCT